MKLLELGKIKKIIIDILILTISLVILLVFIYRPIMKKIMVSKQKLKKISNEILNTKQAIELTEQLQQKNQKEAEKFSFLKERLYDERQFTKVLKNLEDLAARSGLKVISIDYHPQKVYRFYKEIPLELNTKSKYVEILAYLRQLERLSVSINIGDLQIQVSKDDYPELDIKLVFLNYILRKE